MARVAVFVVSKKKSDLFFELGELFGQVLHQLVGGVELSLEVPVVTLLAVPVLIGQRHGSHPGEPVQILILTRQKYSHFSSNIVHEEAYLISLWVLRLCLIIISLGRLIFQSLLHIVTFSSI